MYKSSDSTAQDILGTKTTLVPPSCSPYLKWPKCAWTFSCGKTYPPNLRWFASLSHMPMEAPPWKGARKEKREKSFAELWKGDGLQCRIIFPAFFHPASSQRVFVLFLPNIFKKKYSCDAIKYLHNDINMIKSKQNKTIN